MNGLDILIGLLLIGAVIYGYRQGFIRQVSGFVGWLIGAFLAFRWAPSLQEQLVRSSGMSEQWSPIVAFVLISVVTAFAFKMIGTLLDWVVRRGTILRTVNSLGGAVSGVVAMALLIGATVVILEWSPTASWAREPLQRSTLAARLSRAVQYPAEFPRQGH